MTPFWADTAPTTSRRGYFGVPGERAVGADGALDRLMAPPGALPAGLAASQRMDTDGLAGVLDRIGPAVVDGVTGNGHALIYESNSDEALAVVRHWIAARAHHEVTS